MAPSSPKQPIAQATVIEATVVDVVATEPRSAEVVADTPATASEVSRPSPNPRPPSNNGGGLVVSRQGGFKAFLAPLKRDTFKQVVTDVEDKLRVVNQTLSMLDVLNDNQGGFESVLEEMLESISLKTGELLNADRTTIYLLDEERGELWSKVAKGAPEIRIPSTVGISGEVATSRKVINIPYDFYNDPRSAAAKKFDQQNHYRTYTMLVMPLLNEYEELVAVVQLINKLKPGTEVSTPLADKIDLEGFTSHDEQVFREFAPSIRLILESSRAFYSAIKRQRAANALMKATEGLSK
ncbi:MAG TPA: GAF domain-containing protein, partial [Coleofasciculaceae cyanobacterium]